MKKIYYILYSNWSLYKVNQTFLEVNRDRIEPNLMAKMISPWRFEWVFWREDFANIWKDFYNWEITIEQKNILFNNIKK